MATVNPFAAAAKKKTTPGKPAAAIFPASDVPLPTGGVMYAQADVSKAIERYVEGHIQLEQAQAMKDTNRPILLAFTRYKFAQQWLNSIARPANPSITTREDGDGTFCKVIFQDSKAKLNDGEFEQLARVIGKENAEKHTVRQHEFTINGELLDREASVIKDGRVVKMNVMEAITEALQEKFGPSPDILANLFTAKEKFEVRKGLINHGPALVAPNRKAEDVWKLMEFMEVGKFTTQIKPGASGDSDDD